MESYSLKILELFRKGKMLNINLRVNCPYDPKVRNPKVTVIFSNGVETRRLPVIVQAYFPNEDLNECTIFAKYNYNLEYLFFNTPVNKKIDFWFEFTYGDIVIDSMEFRISRDVKLEEEEDDKVYNIYTSDDNKIFTFELLEDQTEKTTTGIVKSIQNFVKGLWTCILVVLSVPLLPVYFVESVLALIGCAKKAPKNKKWGPLKILFHMRWRVNRFTRKNFGITDSKIKTLHTAFNVCSKLPIKQNRVVFISNRRNDLTGNFEFVYNILKEDKTLDIRFLLDDSEPKRMSYWHVWLYGYYCATSKVILVDDFISLIYKIPRREGTTMIQLWHACGAFKTFGYSRLGKPGGQKQKSPSHRNYDYAIVSSKEISKFYAEGFGISLEKAVATGIPRTDIFFDDNYKKKVQEQFYSNYPQLKNKKILLFAPTFRGKGKLTGFYPVDKFDVVRLYEELNKEYAIIIKHHPFVQDRNEIPDEYKEYIIDMSDNSELNDLLFVSDLLVTDYSSVIFEAALLDIPMLFFAYDLQRYIATRGFYYEYEKFVPGKIVRSFGQAVTAIKQEDFEAEKIKVFKTRFFDDLDGKSSERTVKLIYDSLKK